MFQFSSGTILGRYELLIPVAQGGMADVWAARLHGTRGFTKLVAIKTIRSGALDDARLEQMLMAEARLAAQIDHPNVISTLELGEQNNTLFLVMEWADAEPLSVLLNAEGEQCVPYSIAANIIAQACRGVHCAHELHDADGNPLGVVHRDLSPQNLLLTYSGIIKVVDFGVAKATHVASALTEDGELKGKLAYMSPEQVRGDAVDRRSDVFALGAILYLLTTGQHPFKCTHPAETLARLASDAPILPPNRKLPDYPLALQAVVLRALNKDREKRYESAGALLQALEEALPESKGIEGEVAKFLVERAAGLGERRRRHVRAAGDLLDRSEPSSASQSPASISAVAVNIGSDISAPNVSAVAEDSEVRALEAAAFKRPAWKAWAAGAVALIGIGVGFGLAQSGVTAPPRSPAAAMPLSTSAGTLQFAPSTSAANPAPSALVSAPARWATQDAIDMPSQLSSPIRSLHPLAQARANAAAAPKLSASHLAPAQGNLPPEPAASANSEPPTSSVGTSSAQPPANPARARRQSSKGRKKDSWDPSTFGGRL